MIKNELVKKVFILFFLFFSHLYQAQVTFDKEKLTKNVAKSSAINCTDGKSNAERTSSDLANPVNVGTIDDRTCYADYEESQYNSKTWGVYNIATGSNHLDNNGLQPRIERSLDRSQETGIGSYAKLTGNVRILEVGVTDNTNNDGTYIMQAKGKHTGGGGSADPAICLYLAKPVYGMVNGESVQVSFDIYREQINYRGGEGADGRTLVFLTNILKDTETSIVLEVGFKQDPNDAAKRIHYADAEIGGTSYNFEIPEPEKGTESGIRYGAYRVKGGYAQIRWANTTYDKVENALVGATITSAQSGNFENTSTWVGGVAPVNGDSANILTGHDVVVNSGTDITLVDLTIGGSGSQLDQLPGSKVTITGTLTAERTTDYYQFSGASAGDDIGTFILNGTDASSKRMRIVKKVAAADTWYLMSFGTTETRINELFPGQFAVSTTTGNEGNYSFASYDPATSSYSYDYNSGDADYANGVHTINGKGYALKTKAGQVNVITRAKFQTADVSIDISDAGSQFNLVGNPYPAYILAADNEGGADNILKINGSAGTGVLDENTIWLWDGANTTWVTKNLGDTFNINPMQGFFVKAKTGGGASQSFQFNKAMQTHTKLDNNFKSSDLRFEIDLSIANGKRSKSTTIRYMNNKTISFDNGFDSSIFGGYASELEVYTRLVNGNYNKKLAIQSLPNENYENMVVPIGVTAMANSVITFSLVAKNVPTGYKVFLEDRIEGVVTRLDEVDAKYVATVIEKSTEGRFFLHTKSETLSTNSELLNSVCIYKSNASTLRIVGLSKGKTSVKLFNLLGKQLLHDEFNINGVKELSIPRISSGVYIIHLETKTGKLNKKIVLE